MRTSSWLIGGLIVSMVLNLLLIGVVIGRLSGFGPPPGMGPDPTAGFFRMLGFLSDERRGTIAPDLRRQMGDLMPVLHKMRGDQRAVFEALIADPFDSATLEQVLANLRTNLSAAQVASHHAFVLMAQSLTPDERKELARVMRHRPPMSGIGRSGRPEHPLRMHPGARGLDPPQEDR